MIRTITGPIGITFKYRYLIRTSVSMIIFSILLFIIYLIIKRTRGKPAVLTQPHAAAFEELDKFSVIYADKGMSLNDYFFKIVDILRIYLDKRYNTKSSAMTTEQFIERFMRIREISKENKEYLMEILKKKDNIKFSAGDISQDELQPALSFVRKFIENTKEERW